MWISSSSSLLGCRGIWHEVLRIPLGQWIPIICWRTIYCLYESVMTLDTEKEGLLTKNKSCLQLWIIWWRLLPFIGFFSLFVVELRRSNIMQWHHNALFCIRDLILTLLIKRELLAMRTRPIDFSASYPGIISVKLILLLNVCGCNMQGCMYLLAYAGLWKIQSSLSLRVLSHCLSVCSFVFMSKMKTKNSNICKQITEVPLFSAHCKLNYPVKLIGEEKCHHRWVLEWLQGEGYKLKEEAFIWEPMNMSTRSNLPQWRVKWGPFTESWNRWHRCSRTLNLMQAKKKTEGKKGSRSDAVLTNQVLTLALSHNSVTKWCRECYANCKGFFLIFLRHNWNLLGFVANNTP